MSNIALLTKKLNDLLEIQLIPHLKTGGPIADILEEILRLHNENLYEFRDRELTRLGMLVDELNQIRQHDNSLLNNFRKDYKQKVTSIDYFYGFRAEVTLASLLAKDKLIFIKRERPDFEISFTNNSKIYAECTSTHLFKHRSDDLSYKIQLAIRRKLNKNYLNDNSILFIDITNLLRHTLVSGTYMDQSKIESTIRSEIDGKSIGTVIISHYVLNKDTGMYLTCFNRYDNSTITEGLLQFLNLYFPNENNILISNYDIPKTP